MRLLHDYADMLLERGKFRDQLEPTAMLNEALQISSDLGMRPFMDRLRLKCDILKV